MTAAADLLSTDRSLSWPAVQTERLSMHYQVGPETVRAVDCVDLAIPRGQFLLVRGRSGSGKTTLLHLLAGLQKPTSGVVRVGGQPLHEMGTRATDLFRRRNVGLIFQFFNLIPSLTVEMNIALPLLLDGKKLPSLRDRIGELLDTLGMSHRRGHSPHQLSGGEMQRVAIARAMIVKPTLVLADEPTGNLDGGNARGVLELMLELNRELGTSLVIVTHAGEIAGRMQRVLELNDGRLGSP